MGGFLLVLSGSLMNCNIRFWNNYPSIGIKFHIRDLDAWQRGWILTGSHFSRSSFTFVEVKITIKIWSIQYTFLLVQGHSFKWTFLLKRFKNLKGIRFCESEIFLKSLRWNKLRMRVMPNSWFDCEFLYDSHVENDVVPVTSAVNRTSLLMSH